MKTKLKSDITYLVGLFIEDFTSSNEVIAFNSLESLNKYIENIITKYKGNVKEHEIIILFSTILFTYSRRLGYIVSIIGVNSSYEYISKLSNYSLVNRNKDIKGLVESIVTNIYVPAQSLEHPDVELSLFIRTLLDRFEIFYLTVGNGKSYYNKLLELLSDLIDKETLVEYVDSILEIKDPKLAEIALFKNMGRSTIETAINISEIEGYETADEIDYKLSNALSIINKKSTEISVITDKLRRRILDVIVSVSVMYSCNESEENPNKAYVKVIDTLEILIKDILFKIIYTNIEHKSLEGKEEVLDSDAESLIK